MILILPLPCYHVGCCCLPHNHYYCCYYLHYLVKGSYIVYLPFRFRFRTCDVSLHPPSKWCYRKNCLRELFAHNRSMPARMYHIAGSHHRSTQPLSSVNWLWHKRHGSVYIVCIYRTPHYLPLTMWFRPLKCTNLFILVFWRVSGVLRSTNEPCV